jgi:hypothetical protein
MLVGEPEPKVGDLVRYVNAKFCGLAIQERFNDAGVRQLLVAWGVKKGAVLHRKMLYTDAYRLEVISEGR